MKKETKVCTCRPYFPVRAKMTERFFEDWIDENQAAEILAGNPKPPVDKELSELVGSVFCVIAGGDEIMFVRDKPFCRDCGLPVPIDPKKAAFPLMIAGTENRFLQTLGKMEVIPEDAPLCKFVEQAQTKDNIFPLN